MNVIDTRQLDRPWCTEAAVFANERNLRLLVLLRL
jgi:hypothetical protein